MFVYLRVEHKMTGYSRLSILHLMEGMVERMGGNSWVRADSDKPSVIYGFSHRRPSDFIEIVEIASYRVSSYDWLFLFLPCLLIRCVSWSRHVGDSGRAHADGR